MPHSLECIIQGYMREKENTANSVSVNQCVRVKFELNVFTDHTLWNRPKRVILEHVH